jgi:hypothetical protein
MGPFIYSLGRRNAVTEQLLDLLIIVTIAWIVGFHIVPEAFGVAGFAALGMAFPYALRRIFHLASATAHTALLMLAATALVLHALIDGIALLPNSGEGLSAAVIIHRLPVGMAIWWTFRPAIGNTVAIIAFALIIAATAAAYFLGTPIIELAESTTLALFRAFVSGSLIDLVVVGILEKLRRVR